MKTVQIKKKSKKQTTNHDRRLRSFLRTTFGLGQQHEELIVAKAGVLKIYGNSEAVTERMLDFLEFKCFIGSKLKDVRRDARYDINRSGCLRGFRFSMGLPCNGQRTQTNAMTCKRERPAGYHKKGGGVFKQSGAKKNSGTVRNRQQRSKLSKSIKTPTPFKSRFRKSKKPYRSILKSISLSRVLKFEKYFKRQTLQLAQLIKNKPGIRKVLSRRREKQVFRVTLKSKSKNEGKSKAIPSGQKAIIKKNVKTRLNKVSRIN